MSTMCPALTIFVNIGMVIVIWAGGVQAIRGELTDRADRGLYQLPADHHGPADHDDHAVQYLGQRHCLGQAHQRGAGYAFRKCRMHPMRKPLPENAAARVVFENVGFPLQRQRRRSRAGRTSTWWPSRGRRSPSWAPPARANPRWSTWSRASTMSSHGEVLIDGVDIREIQQDSLLAHIGIVPQETVLFSGTVRDNIRYGRPDASDEEVIAAAQAAQAHDFILAAAQGLRHPRRGARRQPVRRAKAAHRHRPRAARPSPRS